MWNCACFLLFLVAFVSSCAGFRCHVCSYSINTDKNRDCIDALDTLTAPQNFFVCNRSCVIQENNSLEEKKVTSYIRTCHAVTKTGYCVKDTWNLVCFFSCFGELCNNYPGELHATLPVQDPNTGSSDGDGGSATDGNGSHRVNGVSSLFVSCLIIFAFICTHF